MRVIVVSWPTLLGRSLGFALGVTLAVACSSTDPSGPLARANGIGDVCSSVASDGSMTYGLELVNSATSPAVIDSVALVEPAGLSMIEARLVTFEDSREGDVGSREGDVTVISLGPGYPPEDIAEWAASVTAEGATIAPANSSSQVFNLVLGLEMDDDADAATASAVHIGYQVGSRTWIYTTTDSIELIRHGCP